MQLVKNEQYIDKYCWRCKSNATKHDNKINIRIGSLFEGMRMYINGLYFPIYHYFLNHYSINAFYKEMLQFSEHFKINHTSQNLIIKIFREIRQKIKIYYHTLWSNTELGLEPAENGKSGIEIDESKVIGNENNVIWVFGLVDRADKQARVYCVLNDGTHTKLLDIVKKNVYTDNNGYNDDMKTRIYNVSFAPYQTDDFEALGYKLNKVNNSVRFGQGLFHTNTVEGLWSQIKRISHDFSGLNFKILDDIEKNGGNAYEYIDNWLCFSLFIRKC